MQPNIYGFLDLVRLVYKPEEATTGKETFSTLLELNELVHIRAFNKQASTSAGHSSLQMRGCQGGKSEEQDRGRRSILVRLSK